MNFRAREVGFQGLLLDSNMLPMETPPNNGPETLGSHMKNPLIRCISGLRVPGPQCGVSTASCRREGPPLRMDVGGPEFGALS